MAFTLYRVYVLFRGYSVVTPCNSPPCGAASSCNKAAQRHDDPATVPDQADKRWGPFTADSFTRWRKPLSLPATSFTSAATASASFDMLREQLEGSYPESERNPGRRTGQQISQQTPSLWNTLYQRLQVRNSQLLLRNHAMERRCDRHASPWKMLSVLMKPAPIMLMLYFST